MAHYAQITNALLEKILEEQIKQTQEQTKQTQILTEIKDALQADKQGDA